MRHADALAHIYIQGLWCVVPWLAQSPACAACRRYPDWCQGVLSLFACYRLDGGQGLYSENQRASWPHGYWCAAQREGGDEGIALRWQHGLRRGLRTANRCRPHMHMVVLCCAAARPAVYLWFEGPLHICSSCSLSLTALHCTARHRRVRNMDQACYAGVHARVYLRLGIASVTLICLLPPAAAVALMWRCRRSLTEPRTEQLYGFLYRAYRPRFYFWEGVAMLQTLGLVAAEVRCRCGARRCMAHCTRSRKRSVHVRTGLVIEARS